MEDRRIVDIHAHIWTGRDCRSGEDALLRAAERYGIERIFVSALNGYYPDQEAVKEMNAETARFCREHADRISGYVYVSPELPDAVDTLRRGIEDQGLVGVKFWVSRKCDDPVCAPVIEKIIEYGVPLLQHSFRKSVGQLPDESCGEHVARLARRYPECRIIMAHLGGNCYDGVPAIRDCPNVWCDWCGSIFRGNELAYALEMLGEDRLLFGTDMPGPFLVNYGQVQELGLPEKTRRKLLFGNAEKLFTRVFRSEVTV